MDKSSDEKSELQSIQSEEAWPTEPDSPCPKCHLIPCVCKK